MLRWHLQQGRSAIPKSTNPARIAENFDVFDFELSANQLARIDALDTGIGNGPDPDEAPRGNLLASRPGSLGQAETFME
jgi:diketogulonate reductase-like aldo/keto reductase